MNSKVISWFTGGLNYQIEHHLFPKVSHVHYPAISQIVKSTAKEFGIQYHEYRTFFSAVASHYAHLRTMGVA
jgi:linoleoyl-CoA desaturase